MKRPFAGLITVGLLILVASSSMGWEETPYLRVNCLAYPVVWNGRTIMIGARFQVPLNLKGPLPAVIILHGTFLIVATQSANGAELALKLKNTAGFYEGSATT